MDPAHGSVMTDLMAKAHRMQVTLGTTESMTGGLLSYAMASEPGFGDVFKGGITSYDRSVKFELLRVPHGPVVSAPAARQMARTGRKLLGSDYCISITGVAGPEPQDGMPIGTVFMAIAGPIANRVASCRLEIDGQPEQIQKRACTAAARILLGYLESARSRPGPRRGSSLIS
jgi:nicotinamide-nucleotide amidase